MVAATWFVLLVTCTCATLGLVIVDDVQVEKSWQNFLREYGRSYSTPEETAHRRATFEKNLQDVIEHNLAYERGEHKWWKGINTFSDESYEEWLEHRNINCKVKSRPATTLNSSIQLEEMVRDLGNPPASKDWQAEGYVSAYVRNQDHPYICGGCWAFAATSAIESAWAIKYGKKNLVPVLSEQELIDCGTKYGANGCAGGHPCEGYDTVKGEKGQAYGVNYPWKGKKGKCVFKHADKKAFPHLVTLSGYNEHNKVTNMDYSLNVMVGVKGPTTVSVCADKQFKEYKGGVFTDPKNDCWKACKEEDKINHSVIAVGYNKDVFILRNSWGIGWGINGFMHIERRNWGIGWGIKGDMHIERRKGDKVYGACYMGVDQSFPLVDGQAP